MVTAAGATLYLDSNVFIAFLEAGSTFSDLARRLLEWGQAGEVSLVTGDAVVAEVMVGALRSSQPAVIESTQLLLHSDFITLVSHDREDFRQAAIIRGTIGGHLIDALHVATAISSGCDALISHDTRMPQVPQMPILRLDEIDLRQ